jgi:hypothetical protein
MGEGETLKEKGGRKMGKGERVKGREKRERGKERGDWVEGEIAESGMGRGIGRNRHHLHNSY